MDPWNAALPKIKSAIEDLREHFEMVMCSEHLVPLEMEFHYRRIMIFA